MVREHWLRLSQAIGEVAAGWRERKKYTHPTALIVRVYAWAAAHNCSVTWACDPVNWDPRNRPHDELPDQSTVSRRMRGKHGEQFWRFCAAVGRRLCSRASEKSTLLKLRRLDGKPLVVAGHCTDRDAAWGRGAGQKSKGYKLHAIWSDLPMPDQWRVTPLNVDEKHMAKRMIRRLTGCGYILADGHYDDSNLYDLAAAASHQLVAPRQHPGTGLGHHYQSPHRLRAIAMLEVPAKVTRFGRRLYRQR